MLCWRVPFAVKLVEHLQIRLEITTSTAVIGASHIPSFNTFPSWGV